MRVLNFPQVNTSKILNKKNLNTSGRWGQDFRNVLMGHGPKSVGNTVLEDY